MKKLFLFTALAILGFVSCDQKDDIDVSQPQGVSGEPATLTISLTGNNNNDTRSIGAIPSQSNDNTVTKFMVFIFNAQTKEIDKMGTATVAEISNKVMNITASAGSRDIFVVVNPPASNLTALQNVTSEAELKAVTSDLKNETEGSFVMTGKKMNIALIPTSQGPNAITVPVSRLVSRVILSNITTAFTGGLSGASLNIDSIYIMNAVGLKSMGDSAFVVTPATYYTRGVIGFAVPQVDSFSTPKSISNSTNLMSQLANGAHYYVYANPGNTFLSGTRLVVTGRINGVRTYYPVAINVAGTGFTPLDIPGITANNVYNITMNINGFGTDDPNTPFLPANCQITIVPSNWNVVINQNVQY